MIKNLINYKKAWLGAGALFIIASALILTSMVKGEAHKNALNTDPSVRWFYYKDIATNPSLPGNYTLVPIGVTPTCEGTGRLCSIQAPINTSTNEPIDPTHPLSIRQKDTVQ